MFRPKYKTNKFWKRPRNNLRGLGLFWMILGCVAIGASAVTTLATVLMFGVILLIAGVAQTGHAVFNRSLDFSWRFLSGILFSLIGLLLIVDPMGGARSLTLLLSLFFLVGGLLRIAQGALIRRQGRRSIRPHLVAGGLDFILAVLILVGWPATGTWVIGLFVGVELLLGGLFLILSPSQVPG
jgi:uncharacterized membrane protein HdeD (DUF308 family)